MEWIGYLVLVLLYWGKMPPSLILFQICTGSCNSLLSSPVSSLSKHYHIEFETLTSMKGDAWADEGHHESWFFFWINVFLIIRFGRRFDWLHVITNQMGFGNPWFCIPPLLVLGELKNPRLCLLNVGGRVGWKRRKWAGEWRWRDIRLRWMKTKRSISLSNGRWYTTTVPDY